MSDFSGTTTLNCWRGCIWLVSQAQFIWSRLSASTMFLENGRTRFWARLWTRLIITVLSGFMWVYFTLEWARWCSGVEWMLLFIDVALKCKVDKIFLIRWDRAWKQRKLIRNLKSQLSSILSKKARSDETTDEKIAENCCSKIKFSKICFDTEKIVGSIFLTNIFQ